MGEYGNLILRRRDSRGQTRPWAADNVPKDEVGTGNRGLLQNPKARGDYLVWPVDEFGSITEENLLVFVKNRKHARSIFGIDCKSAYDRNNKLPCTLPLGPSIMKSRKQFVVCE